MTQRRPIRSLTEKSIPSLDNPIQISLRQKTAYLCLAFKKAFKRKRSQGFLHIIKATNKALYKQYVLKGLLRLFKNKDRIKKNYTFQRLKRNRFHFKILASFARRSANINFRNKITCMKVAFEKISNSFLSQKSTSQFKRKNYGTPIRQMDSSNITIQSSKVSNTSRINKSFSDARLNKKYNTEIEEDESQEVTLLKEENNEFKLMSLSEDVRESLLKLQRFDRFIYPIQSDKILKKPVQRELKRLEKIKNDHREMRNKYYDNEITITALYNHVKLIFEMNRYLEERDSLRNEKAELSKKLYEQRTEHIREVRELKDENRKLSKNITPVKGDSFLKKRKELSEPTKIAKFLQKAMRNSEFLQIISELEREMKKNHENQQFSEMLINFSSLTHLHINLLNEKKASQQTICDLNNSFQKVLKFVRTNKYDELEHLGFETKIKNIKLLVEEVIKLKKSNEQLEKKQRTKSHDGKVFENHKNRMKILEEQLQSTKEELLEERATNNELVRQNILYEKDLGKYKNKKKQLQEQKQKNRQLIKQEIEFSKQGKEFHLELQKLKRIEEQLELYKSESKVMVEFASKIQKSFKYKKYDQIMKEQLPQSIQTHKLSSFMAIIHDLIKNKEQLQTMSKEVQKRNRTQINSISDKHNHEIKQLQAEINAFENDKYLMIQTLKSIDRTLSKNRQVFWNQENFIDNLFKSEIQKRKFHNFQVFLVQVKVLINNICLGFCAIHRSKQLHYHNLIEMRNNDNSQLQIRFDAKNKELAEKQMTFKVYDSELDNLSHQLQVLSYDNQKMLSELEVERKKEKEHIQEVQKLKKRIQEYIQQEKKVLQQFQKLEKEKKKYKEDYQKASEKHLEMEQKIFQQNNQLIKLENQNFTYQNEIVTDRKNYELHEENLKNEIRIFQNQLMLTEEKKKELSQKIKELAENLEEQRRKNGENILNRQNSHVNTQLKQILVNHEMQKEELIKYSEKVSIQLQNNIINFNEERKMLREEVERVRNEEYQINYEKIKKQREEIRSLSEERDQLTQIIQTNEKNFIKIINQNRQMFEKITELETVQGQMVTQLRLKDEKIQQGKLIMMKIEPLQEKIQLYESKTNIQQFSSQNYAHSNEEKWEEKIKQRQNQIKSIKNEFDLLKEKHQNQRIEKVKLEQKYLKISEILSLKEKQLEGLNENKINIEKRCISLQKQLLVLEINMKKQLQIIQTKNYNLVYQMKEKQETIDRLQKKTENLTVKENIQLKEVKQEKFKFQKQLMYKQCELKQKEIIIKKIQLQNIRKEQYLKEKQNLIQNMEKIMNELKKNESQSFVADEKIRQKSAQIQSLRIKVQNLEGEKLFLQQKLKHSMEKQSQSQKKYLSFVEKSTWEKKKLQQQIFESERKINSYQNQISSLLTNQQTSTMRQKHLTQVLKQKNDQIYNIHEKNQSMILNIQTENKQLKKIVSMLNLHQNEDDENEVNILMKISEEVGILIDRNLELEERLKLVDLSTENDQEWYESVEILLQSLVEYLKENKLVGNYSKNFKFENELNELDFVEDSRQKFFIYAQNFIKDLFDRIAQNRSHERSRISMQEIGSNLNYFFRSGNQDYLQKISKIVHNFDK